MLSELIALVTFVFVAWFTYFIMRRIVLRRGRRASAWRTSLAAQIPQSAGAVTSLEQDLWRSGAYEPWARRDFLVARNLLVFFCLAATGVILVSLDPTRSDELLQAAFVGGVVTLLAYAVPRIHLAWLARRRVRRIEAGLPAAVDMITMCMSGGLSLEDGLTRTSHELGFAERDVALELAIIRRQAEVSSLTQSLRSFARRIDTPAVNSLASLITQSERLGTNIARALHDYSDGLRLRARQRAEERANKTGIRMLFPLVLCMAPSVFVLIWGPALLQVREFVVTEMGPDGMLSQDVPVELLASPTIGDQQ